MIKKCKFCEGNTGEYNPSFCFGAGSNPNLVGCVQMGLGLDPVDGIYRIGKWINLRGDYRYFTEQMYAQVANAQEDYRCPFIDARAANLFISIWPRIINPNEDPTWSIWPPEIGSDQEEALSIGVVFPEPFGSDGEEWPIISDTNYFLELIDLVYGKEIPEDIREGLFASYNRICEDAVHYFD